MNWARAGTQIFLPLGLGPLLAIAAAALLYALLSFARARLGITRETCVCVGREWVPVAIGTAALRTTVAMDQTEDCRIRYSGAVLGVSTQQVVDGLHYLSAGAVSFARGVSDTPKIVALSLMAAPMIPVGAEFVGVGLVIAIGGLLGARRVAETMSKKITAMNPGQGLTANLVTSVLVLAASSMGWPLSTTHVSCGALFGIGAVNLPLPAGAGSEWGALHAFAQHWEFNSALYALLTLAVSPALARGLLAALVLAVTVALYRRSFMLRDARYLPRGDLIFAVLILAAAVINRVHFPLCVRLIPQNPRDYGG